VTAAVWGLGERLLARCAELGIYRCAVVAPTRDMGALQSFLDRYRQVADRVCR
jgi:nucleotidyltransferase/DNA polymerase involved in DNA repair